MLYIGDSKILDVCHEIVLSEMPKNVGGVYLQIGLLNFENTTQHALYSLLVYNDLFAY